MAKRILMVVTSHDRIGNDVDTGVWFDEFAEPWRLFSEAGCEVTVASTHGGTAPVDPRSRPDGNAATDEALDALAHTLPLSELEDQLDDFDAVFFPGGHGTMFDFPENPYVTRTVERFLLKPGGVVGAVCHGPAALIGAKDAHGETMLRGRRITGFTNAEEHEVGLDGVMPFLLENQMRDLGAQFVPDPNWSEHVEVDGNLITGQNPQSSARAAQEVLRALAG